MGKSGNFRGAPDHRVLIIGGGFGAIYTALGLERVLRRQDRTEVTLISPENFFLFTPMLAEIVSSQIDTSHAINPIRRMFKRTRFVEGTAVELDLENRSVLVHHPGGDEFGYPYDHLVVSVGAQTAFFGMKDVEENAYTAKTLGDAILLRNRVIALLEVAEIERDPASRGEILTIAVVGGGFTGVEIAGELNDLIRVAARSYPTITQREIRVILVEAKDRLLPEFDEKLADFATEKLKAAGVEVRLNASVHGATDREVRIKDADSIPTRMLVWTTGVAPHPLISNSALPKTGRGWIEADADLRVTGLAGTWALGDCASIPNVLQPGHSQPALAQHAIREGSRLAKNIAASIRGEPTEPFRYRTLGQMATLGHYKGVGMIGPIRISGFIAWAVWRSYYLWRLPRWEKRLRVATDWTVDLIFGRDISQIQTYASTQSRNASIFSSSVEGGRSPAVANPVTKSTGDEGSKRTTRKKSGTST